MISSTRRIVDAHINIRRQETIPETAMHRCASNGTGKALNLGRAAFLREQDGVQ
jgi:hypothetical protein